MAHRTIRVLPKKSVGLVGKCIWCGALPQDGRLSDEHAIPASLGGHWVLQQACCRKCEGIQSAYIGKCCDVMFSALRFHQGLPISKKRKLVERKVRVWTSKDETTEIPQENAPGIVVLPVLELPRLLSCTTPFENEFLLIGTYVSSTTEDAVERQRNLKANGYKSALGYAAIPVSEFTRVIAHIGHTYYMSSVNPCITNSLLLPIALGDLRNASLYIGGWPANSDSLPAPKGESIHEILPFNARSNGVDYVAARIRLFMHLDPSPPTYTVLLCERAIPKGEQYMSFKMVGANPEAILEISSAIK